MIVPIDFTKSSKFGFSIKLLLFIFLFYTVIFYSSMAKEDFPKLKKKWDEISISKMAPPSNQAHTKIVQTVLKEGLDGKDRCE